MTLKWHTSIYKYEDEVRDKDGSLMDPVEFEMKAVLGLLTVVFSCNE